MLSTFHEATRGQRPLGRYVVSVQHPRGITPVGASDKLDRSFREAEKLARQNRGTIYVVTDGHHFDEVIVHVHYSMRRAANPRTVKARRVNGATWRRVR